MVTLTRITGAQFALNPDLIERVDCTPDTVITLVDGTKYLVRESLDEVVCAVRDYRARVLGSAVAFEQAPEGAAGPPQPPVRRPRRRPREPVMDRATPIGVGLAFAAIIGANILEGGNPMSLLLLPPIILVLGGTIGAAIAGCTMADLKSSLSALKRAMGYQADPPADLVPVVVDLADKARRGGLLTLEDAVADMDDEFLKKGVSLAVDGTDPEELREIMEAELYAKKAVAKQDAKFYNDMGGYAPTIGIIGTVMGLVHVLENLSEPDKLGHLIAGAFVATLWGVMTANVLWLPIGSRLIRIGDLEAARMEVVIEGVLAVQAGSNPRVVAQRLQSLLADDGSQDAKAA